MYAIWDAEEPEATGTEVPCGQRQSDVAGALRTPEFVDLRIATAMSSYRHFLWNIIVPNIIDRIL
jgi:hypothetical protein